MLQPEVILASGWLNYSYLKPFNDVSLHFFHICVLNLKLFDKYWFVSLQENSFGLVLHLV